MLEKTVTEIGGLRGWTELPHDADIRLPVGSQRPIDRSVGFAGLEAGFEHDIAQREPTLAHRPDPVAASVNGDGRPFAQEDMKRGEIRLDGVRQLALAHVSAEC